jgi:mono/diheme cytochrome c family protein
MSQPAGEVNAATDGLWRWLLGGLAAGGVILGLLIAAYVVGYHRGRDHAPRTATNAAASTTTTAATTTTAPPVSARLGRVTVTAALVARGKVLYTRDCSGCHSLTGAAGAGPSFKGLAGGATMLSNGQTLTADDAYLERSIVDPDAQIVKGYTAGLMAPAVASFDLAHRVDDLRALVAFIKSNK